MIEDRAPGVMWALNRNLTAYVRTEINDHIVITGPDTCDNWSQICLTRRQARLLAKRINQCLDETAKR